ncbi:deoxyxylulose-5-phosphate synthase [Kitasatospora sp. NPDC101183]|uniref:deoxyxylulose-5-phosphate synthase n=1 Tax=Kitasatospora sp. NPDC101183 TaxID=3364100 RepID=UPI0037F50727
MTGHTRTSYVCLPCRASYKKAYGLLEPLCPRCAGLLFPVGSAFAAPRRRDRDAWRTLTVLLNAGITFHKSCCSGPGYRPRTRREVLERLAYARAVGEPAHVSLRRRELP